MKQHIISSALLLLVAACQVACANTNYVLVGYDFQTNIYNAAPGDTLVVQGGPYYGTLTFTNPITVLCSGASPVQFVNPVIIQSAGSVNFGQSQFNSGVTVQNSALSFTRATVSGNFNASGGATVQALDCAFSGPISATGGKLTLKRCNFSSLTLAGGVNVECLSSTCSVGLGGDGTGSGAQFVAVQSSFAGLGLTGYKVWLGYCNFNVSGSGPSLNYCDAVLVGNIVSCYSPSGATALSVTGGKLKAYNNVVNMSYDNTYDGSGIVGLRLDSSEAAIVNNTIKTLVNMVNSNNHSTYSGVSVNGGGPVLLQSDIVVCQVVNGNSDRSPGYCVSAANNPALTVSYCCLSPNVSGQAFQNVTSTNNLVIADPQLSGWALQAGSPCINAGPPDVIYNDRGTTNRNDIGYTGGPIYNPANYTNNNPMVFFLTGSPQTVFKGAQTNIQVNVGASAGH
jgi:hypothetical protein